MVSNTIVSLYTGDLPTGKNRKISAGPLYPAEDVLGILKGQQAIVAWTDKAIKDVQRLALDDCDLLELVEIAVQEGTFKGSEWCVQRPNGPWAACDAYVLVRTEQLPHLRREMDCEYYIKFAIGRTGTVFLLASCHLPEDRRF